jgi:hypothetical protein
MRSCRVASKPEVRPPLQRNGRRQAPLIRPIRPPSLIGKKLDRSIAELDEFTFEMWVEIEKEKVPVYGVSELLDCVQGRIVSQQGQVSCSFPSSASFDADHVAALCRSRQGQEKDDSECHAASAGLDQLYQQEFPPCNRICARRRTPFPTWRSNASSTASPWTATCATTMPSAAILEARCLTRHDKSTTKSENFDLRRR